MKKKKKKNKRDTKVKTIQLRVVGGSNDKFVEIHGTILESIIRESIQFKEKYRKHKSIYNLLAKLEKGHQYTKVDGSQGKLGLDEFIDIIKIRYHERKYAFGVIREISKKINTLMISLRELEKLRNHIDNHSQPFMRKFCVSNEYFDKNERLFYNKMNVLDEIISFHKTIDRDLMEFEKREEKLTTKISASKTNDTKSIEKINREVQCDHQGGGGREQSTRKLVNANIIISKNEKNISDLIKERKKQRENIVIMERNNEKLSTANKNLRAALISEREENSLQRTKLNQVRDKYYKIAKTEDKLKKTIIRQRVELENFEDVNEKNIQLERQIVILIEQNSKLSDEIDEII